jgi:hypothetical protein
MVNFVVVRLSTSLPVNESLQVVKSFFRGDKILTEHTPLRIDIMQLLETCLEATYFHIEDKCFQ